MAYHDFAVFTLQAAGPHRTLVVSQNNDYLRFEEESVFHLNAKFGIERVANGRFTSDVATPTSIGHPSNYISATADKPVDDWTSDQCTLFKLIKEGSGIRFSHARFGKIGMRPTGQSFQYCLSCNVSDTVPAIATYVDPTTLVKFPRRVSFQGVTSKKFLTDFGTGNHFGDDDCTRVHAMYDVHHTNNGDIRVKNCHAGMWWEIHTDEFVRSSNRDDSHNDSKTVFQAIKVDGDNVIALRSRWKGYFCIRHTIGSRHDRLNARATTIGRRNEGYLKVVEPISRRRVVIHDVDFKLDKVKIYTHHENVVMSYMEIDNGGTRPIKRDLVLSKEYIVTKTWKHSQTVTKGTTMSLSSGIPEMGAGQKFSIGGHFDRNYEWSTTKITRHVLSKSSEITVLPGKKVKAFLKASMGSYEIPFSYTQTTQYLTTEDPETLVVHDGVFSGNNVYHYELDIQQENLV